MFNRQKDIKITIEKFYLESSVEKTPIYNDLNLIEIINSNILETTLLIVKWIRFTWIICEIMNS